MDEMQFGIRILILKRIRQKLQHIITGADDSDSFNFFNFSPSNIFETTIIYAVFSHDLKYSARIRGAKGSRGML